MTKIRPYEERDRDNLREICVATTNMKVTKKSRLFIPMLWNDYYTEYCSEYIYVVANDADEAVGYILCAPNREHYKFVMREEILPAVKKIAPMLALVMKNGLNSDDAYAEDYPAHMHIDILPEYQRGGFGHKLVDALTAKLRANNIHGLMLGCSTSNVKGMSFYKNYGFKEVDKDIGTTIFGLKF